MSNKTGICFYREKENTSGKFDLTEIRDYAIRVIKVHAVFDFDEFKGLNRAGAVAKLKEYGITRLIIAGEYPGFCYDYFRDLSMSVENLKVSLLSFAEFCNLNGKSTEIAKGRLFCEVKNISTEKILSEKEFPVNPDTLVIGGGIAGIQASLEIANGGQKVYLLEKTGTIGGHMAMFDKTFPTLDCAACILTPKMVEVGQHSNIKLITYAEVKEVSGKPGDFKVKIHQKARRVNIETCIGCGTCSEKCPSKAPSEFDSGTTLRKAIYIPFPQAVPNKYLIDEENCTYVENGKCGICVKFCPVPDCINLDEKDSEFEINVGNIIVATGFSIFDAKKIDRFGYGRFPNVLTSLEFERLINASGPTGGNITFRSQDKKGNWIFETGHGEPESVAIIHCIGSRDENYHKYCSKVCCMYSLKLAHLVKEKLHHAEVYEYYIDMRAFGKGYEEFYERIRSEGVHIIRGKTAKIDQREGKLKLRSEDMINQRIIEQEVDMVILAVGLEARQETSELAEMLGLVSGEDGWLSESHYLADSSATHKPGVSIAGVCQGPKDIPDTVAQASAAAARVLKSIMAGKHKISFTDLSLAEIENQINKLKPEVQE